MGQTADLVVIGGGPAGAVSAWLAARDGARVVLVDPDEAPDRIEGMSPRLHAWLGRSGMLEAGALEPVPAPRRSLWSGTMHEGNHELLVARPALDRALRRAAARAGAQVITGIATPEPGAAVLGSGERLAAALVLDARGRRGAARRPVRRGPATVSLGAWLAGPPSTPPQTVVLPFDAGWAWFAGMGGGRAWLQVTLDAADPHQARPAARLARCLAQCAAWLPEGFRPESDAVLVRESSPLLSGVPADLSVLPVGDAGAAMDPLSGHGMFWAVSSALAAAAVRRTLAAGRDAGGDALARRFLGQRATDLFLRQARIGRDFIRAETARAAAPFWRARSGFPDDAPAHAPTTAISTERRVVVEDGRLSEREVLISPRSPAGVAWYNGLSAVALWQACSEAPGAPLTDRFGAAAEGFEAWLMGEATDG